MSSRSGLDMRQLSSSHKRIPRLNVLSLMRQLSSSHKRIPRLNVLLCPYNPVDDVFVGESFTRQCGGNTAAYWWLNGRLTNVTGNLYRVQNATVDHNGTLQCTATDQEKSHVLLAFEIRIHSESTTRSASGV